MIPPSGSGRSAPLPAPACQRKRILEIRTPPPRWPRLWLKAALSVRIEPMTVADDVK